MSSLKLVLVLFVFCHSAYGGDYDYGDVISKSLLFYEAQRTGKLPANNRISWRGDSMMNDRGDSGEDLTGGYFDAGDFVKFGFPFASAMTMMAWGIVEYEEGFRSSGQLQYALDALKWGTDYMIKAHPSANALYVQVGNGVEDHAYWGRPEDWTKQRPTLKCTPDKPGSEVAGETSAALAAASIIFRRNNNTSYANTLLAHSEQLYNFANNHRGTYSDSFPEIAEYYKSWSGYGDELAWAAAWLYKATGTGSYLTAVNTHWNNFGLGSRPVEQSWDNKQAGMQILMSTLSPDTKFKNAATLFCNWVANLCPRTPKGLVFISEWGSLRHTANAVFACMVASPDYHNLAKQQIDYMLGDAGRSYVVGFGNNPPQRPHHASSSCRPAPAICDWSDFSKPEPNYHTLHGALVGGPDRNDQYVDDRQDYVKNEVTLDYNAGFQSALAGLKVVFG